ncbi:DUF2442 domain-containing protein [Aquabacterium sp. CECT 9606]|uniref:DUF2442 domain-containing protein n=1 Tax=Aquabacterium sp. CECT 9606 TaxID=2845822 RepID=UPI001E39CBBF|nr:DUF2442 domain-containing protein [Aquabacterium sp. CECT 9606]CAH0348072.1 hypothetical protein AQB9606_00293 [Aquabacterium sp. CECT 9606]
MKMTEPSRTNRDLLKALQKVRAISARYDAASGDVVTRLSTGMQISFKPGLAAGLEHSQLSDLQQIEVSPSGVGLHFPALDADLYVPSLLVGILQPKRLTDEAEHEADGCLPQPQAEDLYTYAVRWSAEDQEFVATCTAFPSLSWLAPKPDLALLGVRNLVRFTLADLAADGQQPPANGG